MYRRKRHDKEHVAATDAALRRVWSRWKAHVDVKQRVADVLEVDALDLEGDDPRRSKRRAAWTVSIWPKTGSTVTSALSSPTSSGRRLPRAFGLDVLVEALGGVELGAVAGQVQLDEVGVSGDPVADDAGAVGGVAVEDQHDLAARG